jgi:hypothetical protein
MLVDGWALKVVCIVLWWNGITAMYAMEDVGHGAGERLRYWLRHLAVMNVYASLRPGLSHVIRVTGGIVKAGAGRGACAPKRGRHLSLVERIINSVVSMTVYPSGLGCVCDVFRAQRISRSCVARFLNQDSRVCK